MAVETYTKSGTKASTPAKLDKNIFGLKVENHQLLKEAYLAYLANSRSNLAKAKKRGEVRGGGAKPWRQKGTGRARVGSIRSPIWTGGGVTFGPTGMENYSRKINTKSKRLALRQALSMAADAGRIKVIETFACPEGKVKPTISLLNKIKAEGRVLLVVSAKDELVERATRNLSRVKTVQSNYLTVYGVLNADTIVISRKSLESITARLSASPSTSSGQGSSKLSVGATLPTGRQVKGAANG
ncbi:50S ribosomal protein L4 [Candidatus Saccharibacteria bacterium]|nr:50S ribosomal protein L4 [Candidatus Saccharibacteria bacterium]